MVPQQKWRAGSRSVSPSQLVIAVGYAFVSEPTGPRVYKLFASCPFSQVRCLLEALVWDGNLGCGWGHAEPRGTEDIFLAIADRRATRQEVNQRTKIELPRKSRAFCCFTFALFLFFCGLLVLSCRLASIRVSFRARPFSHSVLQCLWYIYSHFLFPHKTVPQAMTGH